MIRNNFLLVLLTFNSSPPSFFSHYKHWKGTKYRLPGRFQKLAPGSTFMKRNELTLLKAFKSEAALPFVKKMNVNTRSHHQYYNISALCNTNKHFKKYLQSLRVCLHWQQPRPTAQKELMCPFALTRTWSKIFLSASASVKAPVLNSPERGAGLTHTEGGLVSWSGKR